MKIKRTIWLLVCALLVCAFSAGAVCADEIVYDYEGAPEIWHEDGYETVYDYEGAPEIWYEDAPEEDYYADDSVKTDALAPDMIDMGVWGENISWELDEFGYLYVYGEGAFPEGISPWAQYYYNDIWEAEICEGITYIGDDAFAQCYNLQYIYMPDSVEYISETAFVGCDFDNWLTFNCSAGSYSYSYALDHGIIIDGENYYDMPVAQGSFDNITWELCADGNLYIEGEGEIPDYTYELAPWYDRCDYVNTVHIGDGIERIGEFAFQYCFNLREIYIPVSVKEIAISAFFDLDFENLLIHCEENTAAESYAQEYSIPANVLRYDTSGEIGDNVTWTLENGVLELSGKGEIEDYCELNVKYENVTKIVINNDITAVGEHVFSYFFNAKEIELADSIEKIGYAAFASCESLESIKLPKSLKQIDDYAFIDCYMLSEIEFPEKLEKIGECTFAYCTSLETINLLTNVEHIDDEAFYECTGLKDIFIPSAIKRFGDDVFENCSEDLVIHGLAGTKVEDFAKENGIAFEEIPVIEIISPEDIEIVPAIKEEQPPRELTATEKVIGAISDNIIFILCGLCAVVAIIVALIVVFKIKGVKKAK